MPAWLLRQLLIELGMRAGKWLLYGALGALLILGGYGCMGAGAYAQRAQMPVPALPPPLPTPGSTTGNPIVNPPPSLAPRVGLSQAMPWTAEAIIAEAMRWVNARVPYQWGGCTIHGVDCSCVVRNIYAAFGVSVPRTTVMQIATDQVVPPGQMQVGDTIFFNDTCVGCGANPTHEGLIIDPVHQLMIDAGDPVKVESFDTAYWRPKFAGVGRPRV